MNFQWILLALFLVAIVRNTAKSLRNPMLKNFLRLISILVAFVITFILQISGFFQNIIGNKITELNLAAMAPGFETVIDGAISTFLAFFTTSLSPLLFVLVFLVILLILQILHVNLIYNFIRRRKRRKEIREFKRALTQERERMKRAITENEQRFLLAMEELAANHPEIDTYDYDALDENEIDRMVEERIKLEKKKKKKKVGFFKESKERKAISIVCGVVSGFLMFGILWMGLFYTMDVISDVTSFVEETDSSDTKLYQMAYAVDKQIVEPYEDTFVYKFYDSMAIIDLMNYTVRAGGKIDVNGQVVYADDLMRGQMKHALRLACELTSANSANNENNNIATDIKYFTDIETNPITVGLIADFFVAFMDTVEDPAANTQDPTSSILASIIGNYKGENNREIFLNDLGIVSDVIVFSAENRLLAKIISDSTSGLGLFSDRETIKALVSELSGLSFYGPTMEGAFILGIDMIGPMLMPLDNAAGYELFVNNLVSGADGVTAMTKEQFDDFCAFIVEAANFTPENMKPLTDEEGNEILDENGNHVYKYQGVLAYVVDPLYAIDSLKDEAKDLKKDIDAWKDDIAKYESYPARWIQLKIDKESIGLSEDEEAELATIEAWMAEKGIDSFENTEAIIESLKNNVAEFESRINNLTTVAEETIKTFESRTKRFEPFITYFMNWNNVQKPFALANEDNSMASLAIRIFDEESGEYKLYVCNTDEVLTIETIINLVSDGTGLGGAFGDSDNGADDGTEGDVEGGTNEGADSYVEGGTNEGDDSDVEGDTDEGTEGDVEGGTNEGAEGDVEGGTDEGTEDETPADDLDSILNYDVQAKIDENIDKIPQSIRDLLNNLNVTTVQEDTDNKVSEYTDLVNFIIEKANENKNSDAPVTIDSAWLYAILREYNEGFCSADCSCVACRMLAHIDEENPVPFEYKGVTVAQMKDSMKFKVIWDADHVHNEDCECWIDELKKSDSEHLVDVVFTLIDLMGNMNGEQTEVEQMNDTTEGGESTDSTEGGENTDATEGDGATNETEGNSDIAAIISLLGTLGKAMDEMSQTHCIGEIPPLMLEGLLKNDKLSMVMTPSILAQEMADINNVKYNYGKCSCQAHEDIHDRTEACNEYDADFKEVFTYENYMNKLLGTVEGLLEKMNNKGDETV